MGSKYTKRYSEEFKRDAVALVASSGRTVTEVARELGLSSESLRGWVKKANGTGQAGAGAPVAGWTRLSGRNSSGCASSPPTRPRRSRS
ncbi:transposase [Streptomyces plumbiresistens]|uniref:Transposase n=1 Tax=Streptomyces plumbiresistens TaxID=511811 RepID=A0ABP7TDZ4_9ACTN